MAIKYAVMGGTGQIGSVVVAELLKKGHEVRAITRSREKAAAFEKNGARGFIADFADPEQLKKAFAGCDGIFTMIPPSYDADDFIGHLDHTGEAIARAVKESGIKQVVNLSSFGAQHPTGTGPIAGLHRQEQRLNHITGVNILHLRPSYFMQNLLGSIPTIKNFGIITSAIKGDLPIWMVSTDDIGRIIADILDKNNFKEKSVFEFTGPKQWTLNEATRVIAQALNKLDIKYVQPNYTDAEKGMIQGGFKAGVAKQFVEMHKAFNDGKLDPTQALTAQHHGSTSFEMFAAKFAEMYKNSKHNVP